MIIKLKRVLLMEDSEPINSDEWDNWYDYIKYFDSDIPKEELVKLIKKFNLNGAKHFGGKIVELTDGKTKV